MRDCQAWPWWCHSWRFRISRAGSPLTALVHAPGSAQTMALADIGLPELARAVLERAAGGRSPGRADIRAPGAETSRGLDLVGTLGRNCRRTGAGTSGAAAMTPDLAIAALRHAVEHDETQLTAATVDWERFVPVLASRRPSPLLSELYEDRGRQAGELVRGETAVVPGRTRRTSSEPTATSWTSACRPSPRLS
jgi:hypothetical protein